MTNAQEPVDVDVSQGATLIQALLAGGFTPSAVRGLAGDPVLLRRVLAITCARTDASGAFQSMVDPLEPHLPLIKLAVEPLDLEPREWMSFIEERNRAANARPCEIPSGEAFFDHPAFAVKTQCLPGQLLLLETANGQRPMDRIEASARLTAPDCATRTQARAIFEVLRHVWGLMNDINAAYVMLPSSSMPVGAAIPVIINPPQGNIRLGWVKQIPKNTSYRGYVAFIGS